MLDTLLIIASLITLVVVSALALFLGLITGTLMVYQEEIVQRAREEADCNCYLCDYARDSFLGFSLRSH